MSFMILDDKCNPTVFEVCKLHIDLRLTPDVVDHTRCYVSSQSGVDFRQSPGGIVLRIDASEESYPISHVRIQRIELDLTINCLH